MTKTVFISLLLFLSQAAHCEDAGSTAQNLKNSFAGDTRQMVSMPDQARELMRKDMLENLSTLNQIMAYLASNKLDDAAELAETKMGRGSMGKHRGTGMGPGKFMPVEMRNIRMGHA